ncbi:MAG: hypothetical protein A2667_01000 [Candidatus Wildermuthbacteria bacterium RIFCSPHIGHO2_01_FULL_47_27]|uniref:AI-2E family transporter n=2 Tax=Candidatus Wildermuthiibacteriota TaxID=1817923 RepID=A0A1G2RM27_9BACT|nr:MAG: hypothetical protein UY15_C0003G0032 [Parcubacteria group bacterium GW2011_GWA2_47_9]OHA63104.1 MAG: hypothetical protein A2667_01000 [Candidatus Wildermuthbacteria bacterium RIFCSPHIGHO2_01_FULL_47_27]OHA67558.1 MAG: hypothetical protein A3D59_02170 [Candidatus Wildermuthbacteria bacterium RIFCSPHIGHO2_02_FULL_47_17]OHA73877.1 MAG: hypothetical protein A3A32_01635 [Candidatus Wildermuthbacteria bacterium RIFCSPLOWO2_01_FULL_48_35]
MSGERVLDISWATIGKISIAVIMIYVLYLIRDILVWFLFALIISVLFNPAIDLLHRRRVPRVLAASFVYVAVFGGLILFLYSLSAIFVNELQTFSQTFPKYFEQAAPFLKAVGIQPFADAESFLRATSGALQQMAANIFNTLFVVFGGIFSAIFVISVAFFLSLEEKAMAKGLSFIFHPKYEAAIFAVWGRAQKRVTSWFATRILSSIFVGALSYITFFLFNTQYPVSLALAAGIFNFIPIIGPLFTGILIFAVVGLDSPIMAALVVSAFVLIQQVENNILTPALTKKFVGVSPALVLVALAIGGKLWGLLGAILIVPLVAIIAEFLPDFLRRQHGPYAPEEEES